MEREAKVGEGVDFDVGSPIVSLVRSSRVLLLRVIVSLSPLLTVPTNF